MATTTEAFRCAVCGRNLKGKRWITGRDRSITGSIPRYCFVGEGCDKKRKGKS